MVPHASGVKQSSQPEADEGHDESHALFANRLDQQFHFRKASQNCFPAGCPSFSMS